jgi:uncharacterized membrane protein
MFGKLHPLLVHLPIGVFFLGVMLRMYDYYRKKETDPSTYGFIIISSFVFATASCITGYVLSQSGDYEHDALSNHQYTGIGFTVLLGIFYYIHKKYNRFENIGWTSLAIFLTVVGHLGGSLTHGEDFLTSNPSPVKEKKVIKDINNALVYEDLVQPILEEKCYSCHSSSKQKGKLRMDDIASIIKGGKHGDGIKKGDAKESLIIKRSMLPMSHKEHMPPKGKPQLTEKEIAILSWWININTPSNKKVVDLSPTEEIKSVLSSFGSGALSEGTAGLGLSINLDPVGEAPPIDQMSLQKASELGLSIIPIAKNSNFINVNILSKDLDANQWAIIQKLAPNIAWFKAQDGEFSADGMRTVSMMKNLTTLSMTNTKIDTKDLVQLSSLSQLKVLNLSGTQIDAEDYKFLSRLPKLQKIYLYKSGISNYALLKQAIPNVAIDSGGYIVPTLETDTVQFTF